MLKSLVLVLVKFEEGQELKMSRLREEQITCRTKCWTVLLPPTARETLGGIRNSPASRLHMKRTYTGSRSKSKSRKLKITWLAVAPGQVEPGDSRPASPRLRELRNWGIEEGFQNSSSPSSTIPEVCGKPAHRRAATNDHQVVHLCGFWHLRKNIFKIFDKLECDRPCPLRQAGWRRLCAIQRKGRQPLQNRGRTRPAPKLVTNINNQTWHCSAKGHLGKLRAHIGHCQGEAQGGEQRAGKEEQCQPGRHFFGDQCEMSPLLKCFLQFLVMFKSNLIHNLLSECFQE